MMTYLCASSTNLGFLPYSMLKNKVYFLKSKCRNALVVLLTNSHIHKLTWMNFKTLYGTTLLLLFILTSPDFILLHSSTRSECCHPVRVGVWIRADLMK